MKKNEIIYAKKQRDNVSFLKIHKMLASDFILFILCMLMFIISLRIDFLLHPLDRDD